MKGFSGVALLVGLPLCLGNATPVVAPISVDASVDWYGNDGTWSAVNILVGSELKTISVFPNTVGKTTVLVGGSGCDNSSLSECPSKRGGLFLANESTSWRNEVLHSTSTGSIASDNNGKDTIILGSIEVSEQPLEIEDDPDTWIGSVGLAVDESDHGGSLTFNLMETAMINGTIFPSSSYGYTAGAYYRLKGTPASLTIGGVDRARFDDNNVTFHLSRSMTPVVSLNAISIAAETPNDIVLPATAPIIPSNLGGSAYFKLDSSTSFLWLPGSAFDAFGQAFNLTYDDDLGFYTYGNNTSLREQLLSMGLMITFSVSDLPDSSQIVNITLPFRAFDHSLTNSYPDLSSGYYGTSLPYLPVKRASSNDEQRIGRVFFQEAYLTVDYERKEFSVRQAKFDADLISSVTDIITIDSYWNKQIDDIFGKKGLSTAQKAGIGVGSGTAGILIIMACAWLYKRKRRSANAERGTKLSDSGGSSPSMSQVPREPERDRNSRHELPSDALHTVYELPGCVPMEMEAGPSLTRDSGYGNRRDEKRHSARHSETRSSVAASLSSWVTESSDEEDGPAPQKTSDDGPPRYTP
ncbi:hypothetical protein BBP40_003624 [Aspergillus hancockii]|nr:hypothetical protein BBP40_003624 [Aspergillus hancockii]